MAKQTRKCELCGVTDSKQHRKSKTHQSAAFCRDTRVGYVTAFRVYREAHLDTLRVMQGRLERLGVHGCRIGLDYYSSAWGRVREHWSLKFPWGHRVCLDTCDDTTLLLSLYREVT